MENSTSGYNPNNYDDDEIFNFIRSYWKCFPREFWSFKQISFERK